MSLEAEERLAALHWGYKYPDFKALPGTPRWARTFSEDGSFLYDDQCTLIVQYRAMGRMDELEKDSLTS